MTADLAGRHDLSQTVREGLAVFSEVVLPATGSLPSGTAVGAHLDLLDRVLNADPNLTATIIAIGELAAERGCPSIEEIPVWAPEHHESAVFALTAAYYLSPEVLRALNYPGLGPQPIALAKADEVVSEDLLAPVRDRGSIYVPTPE